ncbi:hypothetical protein IGI04_030688, partial [Brassica rapa subsp. trilocularis]
VVRQTVASMKVLQLTLYLLHLTRNIQRNTIRIIGNNDERFETHTFTNTFPTSLDEVHPTSVDTHPRPAKQPLTSIDTHTGTSINIRAAAKIQEQENISSPTRDPDGNARAIDGRILQVSREDIADILQVANGPDSLFSQQRGTPDVIQTDPNNHVGVAITEINPDLSYQPNGQASIDGRTPTSIDRVTPTSIDKDNPTSIADVMNLETALLTCTEPESSLGNEGTSMESTEMSVDTHEEITGKSSHICLPEHATSFTLTRLAPKLYTKDEINEMVTGICGAQEKLGEELKSLVEDTHQPLDRGYNELFRSMQLEKEATTSASIDAPHAPSMDVNHPTAQIPAEPQCSAEHKDAWEILYIDTRINDVYYPLNNNQDLDTIRKKDQQPATSIDVCNITSLDAKVSAMNERLRTYEDMHDHFISPAKSASIDRLRGPWIVGKNPEELLPYTAAEVGKITSKIYTAIDTMEERLDKCCDDIYFPFDNRISGLDSHAEWLQREVKAIQRQLAAQHQISASIDRKRAKSLDGKSPRSTDEHIIASIDAESTPAGEQLIHNTIESIHKELTELSAYAYDNIGWHQVSIDNIQDRLQNISNVLEKMDDKWTRNDEATRNLGDPSRMTLISNADETSTSLDIDNHTTIDATLSHRSISNPVGCIFPTCYISYIMNYSIITPAELHWDSTPIKEFETRLGSGNLQGSLSQRTLGYRSKRSEQSLPVQSWSLILQWKQTLTQERKLERDKLGTNFYLQLQIPV